MPKAASRHHPPGHALHQQQREQETERRRRVLIHRRLLNTRPYRRFRKMLLTARPVCEDSKRAASEDVHHARKLALHLEDLLDEAQCKALCHGCHSVRTNRGE